MSTVSSFVPLGRFTVLDPTNEHFRSNLISACEHFVQSEMLMNDCSHDWNHVQRVRRMALFLAAKENVQDTFAVELAALLHDVKDPKYSKSVTAGPEAARSFLEHYVCPAPLVDKVVFIVSHVSYKKETTITTDPVHVTPELAVVQDADRLDALGAIGIARVFAFTGASLNTTLENGASHLETKILHILERLKTQTARAIGLARHEVVASFLHSWNAENGPESTKMFSPSGSVGSV